MYRPGIRCPTSLPLPISTLGVDCVGRVLHSSPVSALHGVLYRDRVFAIYPFEYQQQQQLNKNGTAANSVNGNDSRSSSSDAVIKKCGYVDAGFTVSIPKHLDAAEVTVMLHTYTPLYQSIQCGLSLQMQSSTSTSTTTNQQLSGRCTSDQLVGKSIVVHNGYTPSGLAYIELAVALGCTQVYATASCVHHAALERFGAIPLGVVPQEGCRAWERWSTLRNVDLVLMHELPSLDMFDLLSSVVVNTKEYENMGSMVYYQAVPQDEDVKEGTDAVATTNENEENTSPNTIVGASSIMKPNNTNAEYDIFDIIEKARVTHEKSTLERRMETCHHFVIYEGVMSGIMVDPSGWKRDVSFLLGLLSRGVVKPSGYECVYSQCQVENVQDRMEEKEWKDNGNGNLSRSVVCLPSTKWRSHKVGGTNGGTSRVVMGDCSEKTKSEAFCSTLIAAVWRKYCCQKSYKCTIEGELS